MQRLTRRLNSTAQPSQLINQLHAAEQRCAEARTTLRDLVAKAPRIVQQLQLVLRDAFSVAPETLLFTEPLPPAEPTRIESLTERALASLSQRAYPADINSFTALSIKRARHSPLTMTPADAMGKLQCLNLLERLDVAHEAYWQALAYGSWRSRKERWAEVYRQLFADKAFVAHQVQDLSDHGLAMVLGIVDAPTPEQRQQAGGFWSDLQVCELVWPGSGTSQVPVCGALHIFRDADQGLRRQVVFLPGLRREFLEFRSLADMQRDLPKVLNDEEHALVWQRLPLRRRDELLRFPDIVELIPFKVERGPIIAEDALRYSALSDLETQWDNELACALAINPALTFEQGFGDAPRLNAITRLQRLERSRYSSLASSSLAGLLEWLLDWDLKRRHKEVNFGQLLVHMTIKGRERLLNRYERALLALLDPQDLSTDTAAFKTFLACEGRWQEQINKVEQLLEEDEAQFGNKDFWLFKAEGTRNRGERLLVARHRALLEEADMQRQLGLIGEPEHKALVEVLGASWRLDRGNSPLRVLDISLGSYLVAGAFVLTSAAALADRSLKQWALLWVPGTQAGLQRFMSMDALTAGLEAGFTSTEGSPLWSCISRRHRSEARSWVRSLSAGQAFPLAFVERQSAVLADGLKAQIKEHHLTLKWVDEGGRPFTEVSDVVLTNAVLASEMTGVLSIAASSARTAALASVAILRLAAEQVKKQPAWLTLASVAVRKQYRAAQRRFLSSVWARDSRLMEVLPDLETFARQQLIEQLTRDGLYPDIDIDTPAFDVPDDVHTQWESHPVRPIGDSGSKVVVSQERRTYSLLQLALRNLDAQAPWTPLILRNTVYRVPKWKERLSADYLIRTLSSMDIGGRYEKRILEAFYPEQAGGVAQELMWRVHQEQARMVLFSACQQGLGKLARRMFTTALAARSAEGLVCDDMHLRLCVVRLCGLTLEQPRHVSALLVIQDRITGTCVVYWPDAIGHRAITEYPNEEAALSELMATAASPIHLPELARKIAPGWEDQALKSYPGHLKRAFEDVIPREMSGGLTKVLERVVSKGPLGILASAVNWLMPKKAVAALTLTDIEDEIRQQISVNPQGWLEIVPTNGHDALSMLAHAQVLGIQRHARSLSNSTEALGEYRAQRLGEQSDIRMRGLLGLIPLVSILVNVYEVLLAARRLSLSGDSRDIVALVFAVHMTVLDIATTFVPQGKLAVGVAGKGVRAGMARALFAYRGGIHSVLMRQAISIQRLAALGDTLLAKTFKGLEAYQLHGLSAGQGVALHGPLNQGSYVLNGKQFVPDGDRAYPVYRRKQENALRVKNPKEDGQNEFFLHIQESGEVLLKADAPEPPAGAQRPLWQPWRGEAPSGPQPGSSRPTTSSTISPDLTPSPPLERLARVLEQPEMPLTDIPSAWGVGPELQPTQITPLSKRLFTISGRDRNYRAIKLREAFFEVLPDGSLPNEQIAFVHDRTPLATDAGFDIARWLGNDISRQPIPVSFDKMGRATLRQVLFTEPLDDSIAKAFPGMTASSRRGVASRLAELADPERSVTASHLLNIRATLDRWLSVSGLPAQTDELFQLLRPTPLPRVRRSIFIGYEALAAGLERLDFTYDASAASLLRTQSFLARTHAVHQAMRNVLEAHGFVIQRIRHMESRIFSSMICTHPSSNKVYFIVERWLDRASVATRSQAKPLLSDAWLDSYWSRSYEKRRFFTVVQQAREQGRLVRLVGGIQHVAKKNTGTVFFIKVVES
ncbi:dermonecrotic toxin domain-containing protein [Pseudomonas spelaei]